MELDQIVCGRCEDLMPMIPTASVDLCATDPPFNINFQNYRSYADNLPYGEYVAFTNTWVREMARILKPTGSAYVFIGDEFAAEMKIALQSAGLHFRNWIIWAYGFGQNQKLKFSRCHTHCLYFTKDPKHFTFMAQDILVPSRRQTHYGDKRARGGGKIPEDIWTVYADEHAEAQLYLYPDELTIWQDSRLCGTFAERLKDVYGSSHGCQMPRSIMDRIVAASSMRGEVVFDPFTGSGTTLLSAWCRGRKYLGIEQDASYVDLAEKRIDDERRALVVPLS